MVKEREKNTFFKLRGNLRNFILCQGIRRFSLKKVKEKAGNFVIVDHFTCPTALILEFYWLERTDIVQSEGCNC